MARKPKSTIIEETPETEARDERVEFDGPILGSFGVPGFKRYGGGYVSEAEEWNPKLKGKKGDKLYREIEDNDALLGGATWGMEALARQVEWRTDAKKDAGNAGQELADWFEGDRHDMETPFESQVSAKMSATVYGWALEEELWKVRRGPDEDLPELRSQYSDGLFGSRDIVIRAQSSRLRWGFDSEGQITGMYQQVETDSKLRFIPIGKAILTRIRERAGSPEGRSLYRNATRAYHFTTTLEEMEAMGISRKLNGLPIARLPLEAFYKNASESNRTLRAYFEDFIKNLALDTVKGGVIPTDEFPGTAGSTGVKFGFEPMPDGDLGAANTAIARWQTNKLIALLWQMLLLGSGQAAGSWSLSSEMTDLIAMAINAILRMIANSYTRIHIPRLARLNGFDSRILPELNYTDIEKPDVLKLWQAMQAFTSAGGVMTDDLENWGRDQSGWPKREEGKAWSAMLRPATDAQATPGTPDLGAGQPAEEAKPAAETALNGAQVTSATTIVQAVAANTLPRDSGVSMLTEFFNLDPARADRIMGSVGRGFHPTALAPSATTAKLRREVVKHMVAGDQRRVLSILREKGRDDGADSHNEAHAAVQNAVERGDITRKPCENCGASNAIAHHPDYKDKTRIRWLCRPCHAKAHGQTSKAKPQSKLIKPRRKLLIPGL